MKYKLKKNSSKLQGTFTVGVIYKTKPYSTFDNVRILVDDIGKKHLVDIDKVNFQDHFLNINKERKNKLIQIENCENILKH